MATVSKCSKCDSPAVRRTWRVNWCAKHYRFSSMRQVAQARKLYAPTFDEMQEMVDSLDGMKCPHCERKMNWLLKENAALVITLQHYRNGTIGVLCKSCNSRHAAQPGDEFTEIPLTHKRCHKCSQVLPRTAFGRNRGRTRSACKTCNVKASSAYFKANSTKVNARQNRSRAIKRNELYRQILNGEVT